MKADVIVIGAGPAGMMAAYSAAEQGAEVLLLEKNEKTGKKLRITGKGRCNLTNNSDVREVMANIPGDGRFLYSALTAFPPEKVMEFFENHGLPLKTERGKRVFPQSDRANDVANLMQKLCRERGVLILQREATGISLQDGAVSGVKMREETISCKACIICTGGLSYPLTGSTGDGYRFARAVGHTITPLRPSLVPLESPDPCCSRLQGLSLKNVELRVYEENRLLCREQGEMLFTHFGVSGPLVLSASARMRRSIACDTLSLDTGIHSPSSSRDSESLSPVLFLAYFARYLEIARFLVIFARKALRQAGRAGGILFHAPSQVSFRHS